MKRAQKHFSACAISELPGCSTPSLRGSHRGPTSSLKSCAAPTTVSLAASIRLVQTSSSRLVRSVDLNCPPFRHKQPRRNITLEFSQVCDNQLFAPNYTSSLTDSTFVHYSHSFISLFDLSTSWVFVRSSVSA